MNCDGLHSVILVEAIMCFYPVASADFQYQTRREKLWLSQRTKPAKALLTQQDTARCYIGQHHWNYSFNRINTNLLLHIKFVQQYKNVYIEADFVTDHRYHCITMKGIKKICFCGSYMRQESGWISPVYFFFYLCFFFLKDMWYKMCNDKGFREFCIVTILQFSLLNDVVNWTV